MNRQDGVKSGIGHFHQQDKLRNDEREAEHGHDGGILLGPGCYGSQERKDQAQAPSPQQHQPDKGACFFHRVAQEEGKHAEAEQAHEQHEERVEQQLAQHKYTRRHQRIKIQHAPPALLQKAFGNGIDADKKLYDPEKTIPCFDVRLSNGQEQHKNGGTDIQQDTIEAVLLPYFKQQFFFKESDYLAKWADSGMILFEAGLQSYNRRRLLC